MDHQASLFEENPRGHLSHEVRETSRESYRDLVRHPLEISGRHLEYLSTLRALGEAATDQEVCRAAGHLDPNYFRPRRNELVKLGLVVEAGRRVCGVTKKKAITWWVKE